jgi:hypothetical protein
VKRSFVETSGFRNTVDASKDDELLRRIQNEILKAPEAGATIAGTGGLRKLRVSDQERGKGKRGGYRVIYLDLPHLSITCLMGLYTKEEKIDISSDEKKIFRKLTEIFKKELSR